jgi:hypothetical protein
MNWKLTERLVAAGVLLYALVLYLMTVAPTASFWDCGEFIAIANRLQVSHPPGAPFYMLVGRLFSMFVPTASVAYAVNLVSVFSSAITVLLTHLIIVRLVREWQGAPAQWTSGDRIAALAGGVVGACTFAVTDSFWFNAVEAEVYAMSMLFTAVVVWLIFKWREAAEHEAEGRGGVPSLFELAANRYLILIAYVFGIAIGVHLLNLLAIFFIALIVFYVEYEKPDWTPFERFRGLVLAGLVSSVAFLVVYPGIVQWLPSIAESVSAPGVFLVVLLALVVFSVWYTHQRQMQAANLVALCLAVVLLGYSTYALIFIRSAANPPIDENDPETAEAIVSYLKREQYGETPILRGPTFDDATGQIGEAEVTFPRRWSPDPFHARVYAQYPSDGAFFWKYQVSHMYIRYFLWNFVGKASDVQDAPAITGLIPAEATDQAALTPSERASRNVYYGLPLLLGLIGMAFHFMRDGRRAFAVLVLFLMTGLGIIIYLNQTPMQPRERDYSYVASFFAFALWIGIGAAGILQLLVEGLREKAKPVLLLVVAALLFGIPLQMLMEGYADHDRSNNYAAPDYAWNMLNSVEENAILFTNGDNDTFPLWYAQEVEGIRQDVRVTNLSLLNTPWYVRQLKNQASRASTPLPISMDEEVIRGLSIAPYQPQEIVLPVDRAQLFGGETAPILLDDSSRIESPMRWTLQGRPYNDELSLLYAADQVALDILMTNARQGWERPIYFAVTVSPDGQLDLQNYFQAEGQAYRVLPIRHEEAQLGRVVPEITLERLRKFRFRGLADSTIYYDENIRRMVDNYRNIYSHAAENLARMGRRQEALDLLNWFMSQVPFETIAGDERSFIFMSGAYQAAGDQVQAVAIMKKAEPLILQRLRGARTQREMEVAARFLQLVELAYLDARDFEAAADFRSRVAALLKDSTYGRTPAQMQQLADSLKAPSDTTP